MRTGCLPRSWSSSRLSSPRWEHTIPIEASRSGTEWSPTEARLDSPTPRTGRRDHSYGTKANVKALTPEMVRFRWSAGRLANAYHLYSAAGQSLTSSTRPAVSVVHELVWPHLHRFGWLPGSVSRHHRLQEGPVPGSSPGRADPTDRFVQMQAIKASNAVVDDDGVIFSSHIDARSIV